jgi:transposase
LLLHALVHPADVQDRDGGVWVMATLFGLYPFLLKLYADGGYQGPAFQAGLRRVCRGIQVEIVKRCDQTTGFAVLPKRWIVGRCTILPVRRSSGQLVFHASGWLTALELRALRFG